MEQRDNNAVESAIKELPKEMLKEIFYFLGGNDIENVEKVCKFWSNIVSEPVFFKKRKLINPEKWLKFISEWKTHDNYPKTKPVILWGNVRSGITALAIRLKEERFDSDTKPTIGVDFHIMEFSPFVKLQILDISGDRSSHNSVYSCLKNAHLVILVIAYGDNAGIENIAMRVKLIQKRYPDTQLFLAVSHLDQCKKSHEFKEFKFKIDEKIKGLSCFTFSNKTGDGIEDLKQAILKTVYKEEVKEFFENKKIVEVKETTTVEIINSNDKSKCIMM